MTKEQAEKLFATMKTAGPLFRASIMNDAIMRLMDAWKGLPYADKRNPAAGPTNVAWLHYYTATEDWYATSRFFDVRDGHVTSKPMFYVAYISGPLGGRHLEYHHITLDKLKTKQARLDFYWQPRPVNDAVLDF